MDIMYFGQLPTPVDVDKDVQMPQFKLIQMSVKDCSQNYTTGQLHAMQSSICLRVAGPRSQLHAYRVAQEIGIIFCTP